MVVFKSAGEENTHQTIDLAVARAKELQIGKIVVASSTGATALRFLRAWPASGLVVVRSVFGFERADVQEMPADVEKQILSEGARIVTAAHSFGGLGRAVRRKFQTYQCDEIVAATLRIFGQGAKVACEIALMACDAGMVRTDEKIVSCGGSGRGDGHRPRPHPGEHALLLRHEGARDHLQALLTVQSVKCKMVRGSGFARISALRAHFTGAARSALNFPLCTLQFALCTDQVALK